MKEKVKKEQEQVVQPLQPIMPQPIQQVVERLMDADKATLDIAKLKRELALANAKTALAQNEASEMAYNTVILQLARRYNLADGDVINDNGEIQRKAK